MRAIRGVVIVGVATNNSVESIARSSSNLGLITTVLAAAMYAYARPITLAWNGVRTTCT